MILASRKDPPRHLTLPKPSKNLAVPPVLRTPLLSPALPSILPRHGKKPPRLNARRVLRYLYWLTLGVVIFVLGQAALRHVLSLNQKTKSQRHKVFAGSKLPAYASPVVVTDHRGRSRWTVSLPPDGDYPLGGLEYADVCARSVNVSAQVSGTQSPNQLRYQQKDVKYIDIEQAQQQGLLRQPSSNQALASDSTLPTCKKSLTYVLDATEARLGESLMGLWLAYSLARRQGRAFFLDDSKFAYGRYSSLFSPLSLEEDCIPPPWEQRTPCPPQADHLLINVATLKWTFGKAFMDKFSTKEIYHMAREGYEALFKLKDDDEKYVNERLVDLRGKVQESGKLIGVHIRRGDQHPYEYQYSHGYLPPSKYMKPARATASEYEGSIIMLGSDDADIYDHPEVFGSIRAQEHIRLASKKQLQSGGLGWEGGFFRDAFWGIGLPEHIAKKKHAHSPKPTKAQQAAIVHKTLEQEGEERDYKADPTPQALQLREYIGRAYLLDLAVLAGSDEIVCGVSSRGCRILGVMMGWDKFHKGDWQNVDGDYGWRALF